MREELTPRSPSPEEGAEETALARAVTYFTPVQGWTQADEMIGMLRPTEAPRRAAPRPWASRYAEACSLAEVVRLNPDLRPSQKVSAGTKTAKTIFSQSSDWMRVARSQ